MSESILRVSYYKRRFLLTSFEDFFEDCRCTVEHINDRPFTFFYFCWGCLCSLIMKQKIRSCKFDICLNVRVLYCVVYAT